MDLKVKCFTVNDQILFNFPEYVDSVLREHSSVKEAGVFKVLFEENTRKHGTSLNDFLSLERSRFSNVQKQFMVAIKEHPNLYGYRGFQGHVDDQNSSNSESELTDASEELMCDVKDIEGFVKCAINPLSYETSTCCSEVLKNCGEEAAVNHFFKEVLPGVVIKEGMGAKYQPMSTTIAQRKRDATEYAKFHVRLTTLPADEKLKLVQKALLTDKRKEKEICDCNGCSYDENCFHATTSTKGIMYGAGIEVIPTDQIRTTRNFGLFCLPTISLLRLLKHRYAGITLPNLYFGTNHSFFPIHIEDGSLLSFNILHYGFPKVWICIPPSAVLELHVTLSATGFNLNQTSCTNLLGHKYFYPTIQWLTDKEIPHKVREGEGIVLAPNTAHFGFNLGPNIAEATNFPTKSWIPYGIVAPKCSCMGGEVHLSLERIIAATEPGMLAAYRHNCLPKVSEEEDPYYYKSILRIDPKGIPKSFPEGNAVPENQVDIHILEDEDEACKNNAAFPDLPTKPAGRKVLPCPRVLCGVTIKSGKKQRLIDHVEKHRLDPDYKELQHKLTLMFPPRDKTKSKRKCNKCGKQVAGRGAQLRIHQLGSGCTSK